MTGVARQQGSKDMGGHGRARAGAGAGDPARGDSTMIEPLPNTRMDLAGACRFKEVEW